MFSEKTMDLMTEMTTKGLGTMAKFAESWPKNGKKYAAIIVKTIIN